MAALRKPHLPVTRGRVDQVKSTITPVERAEPGEVYRVFEKRKPPAGHGSAAAGLGSQYLPAGARDTVSWMRRSGRPAGGCHSHRPAFVKLFALRCHSDTRPTQMSHF
ncbi:hypothetical protein E2C01_007120 [Portunus trituberculatus]|uniref:Uncharacterized protein n=1 Tax=Portunus trituberculatus TaxID=210409 RepID=A0A5B7CZ75_PORTR|nr:hypothetical protein [Portunus trituberculatus]